MPGRGYVTADVDVRQIDDNGDLGPVVATGVWYRRTNTSASTPSGIAVKSDLVGGPGAYEYVVSVPVGTNNNSPFGPNYNKQGMEFEYGQNINGVYLGQSMRFVASYTGSGVQFWWGVEEQHDTQIAGDSSFVAFPNAPSVASGRVEIHVALYAAGDVTNTLGRVGLGATAQYAVRLLDANDTQVAVSEVLYRTGKFEQFTGSTATDLVMAELPPEPELSQPSLNMATLTARSTALNVWSHASDENALRARMAPNAGGEFVVAYDGGAAAVRLPSVKYGVETQTLTTIVDAIHSAASANQTAISSEATTARAAEGAVQANVDAEAGRASSAEQALGVRITNEAAATFTARGTLTTNLATEVADRAAAISAEATLRLNGDTASAALVTTEASTARAAEEANAAAVAAETARALAAEMALDDSHQIEVDRAKAAEMYLNDELFTLTQASNSGVAGEKTRAEGVEAGLQTQISNLLSNTDETALNSLAEIVQSYTDNGADHTAALAAQALKQENERIASDARIAAIEALLEQLQAAA